MKKFALALVIILSISIFTGCMNGEVTVTVLKSNWYNDASFENVKSIDERAVYNIKYTEEGKENSQMSLKDFTGSYEMHLTTDTLNGESVYKLTTKTLCSGIYVAPSGEHQFEGDSIYTEVYFRGLNYSLSPIKSKRVYDMLSPVNMKEVERVKYTVEINYGETAEITYSELSENVEKTAKSIAKYNKSLYFDNEQLLFIGRALELAPNYKQSIKTIPQLDGNLATMNFTTEKEPYKNTDLASMGVSENQVPLTEKKEIRTIKTQISLVNGSFNGAPTTIYYAVKGNNYPNYYSAIISIETSLSYQLGSLVYELKEFNCLSR